VNGVSLRAQGHSIGFVFPQQHLAALEHNFPWHRMCMSSPHGKHFHGMGQIMTQAISHFEEVGTQFHYVRPTNAAPAQASDRHEPWKRIAMRAINDGYIESADEFVRFFDACLRHLAFEQVSADRAYEIGVRNLADAIARRWASENSFKSTPSANEIAGLLQSDWVTQGDFRSLRYESN
jgi:hypothetical protein